MFRVFNSMKRKEKNIQLSTVQWMPHLERSGENGKTFAIRKAIMYSGTVLISVQ